MSKHHPHSPSSYERREFCSYSGKIEPTLPNSTNAMAEEGTMLHDRMETNNFNNLTQEQVDICTWANECIVNIYEQYGKPLEIHKELSMELISNEGNILTNGTADLVLVYSDIIIVADYKFGRGFVSARNNKQLWLYSLMAMQRFDKDKATAFIIQPRCDYFDSYDFAYIPTDIDYITEVLDRCDNATALDAIPSAKACKWCKARVHGKCPALKKSETELMKFEQNDIDTMTPVEVADMLRKVDQVEGLLKGMVQRAERRFEEVGDLVDIFAYKDEYKQGSVKFDELTNHITIENLNEKGFTVTQKEMEDAYVAKNKQGVRGEVAVLREKAKEIYKKLKKGKAVKKGVKVVRL